MVNRNRATNWHSPTSDWWTRSGPQAARIQPHIKGTWVPACVPHHRNFRKCCIWGCCDRKLLLGCSSTLPEAAAAAAQGEWAGLQPSSASTWGLLWGQMRWSAVAASSHSKYLLRNIGRWVSVISPRQSDCKYIQESLTISTLAFYLNS